MKAERLTPLVYRQQQHIIQELQQKTVRRHKETKHTTVPFCSINSIQLFGLFTLLHTCYSITF